jgi:hypothetical protein
MMISWRVAERNLDWDWLICIMRNPDRLIVP